MVAWQQCMRQIRASAQGKLNPFFLKQAQGHFERCRDAIPAYVMPLNRVWDTGTSAPEAFDVVIVDEASQCGNEADALFFLARRMVVVGDDRQVGPAEEGLIKEDVLSLLKQYLYDFEHQDLFSVGQSLYHHAERRFIGSKVILREHFRSMPEIIEFSNSHYYAPLGAPLIPLRQYGSERLKPLVSRFIEDGYRQGDVNEPEARAIVDTIAELCNDGRYTDKSFGVIALLGRNQARFIEQALLERIGDKEMKRRRLICGEPSNFQGDERDVIFLSMVVDSKEPTIGTKPEDQRRFNVAASRARDQMWLFHSVRKDDLPTYVRKDDNSTRELRRALLEHFENPNVPAIAGIELPSLEMQAHSAVRHRDRPPKPFDSWFEVDVAIAIARRGYRVAPQFEVAGRRIDLVVEGGSARLAVECDGEYWHGPDAYEHDSVRQRQLERCGWMFVRIRQSAFRMNADAALSPLWRALEERGILPYADLPQPVDADAEPQFAAEDDSQTLRSTVPVAPSEVESEDDEDIFDDESMDPMSESTRRPAEISADEIRQAIVSILRDKPCLPDAITKKVLRHFGVITRGEPRRKFEKRVKIAVGILERQGVLEKYRAYRAKNTRIRLKDR